MNFALSHDKSLYDLFNMINPNCYQAAAITSVFEKDHKKVLSQLDALSVAIEYYKWDASDKNTDYIDSLICDSALERWQKLAIMYILGCNLDQCRECIQNELNTIKRGSSAESVDYSLIYDSLNQLLSRPFPYSALRRTHNGW